jgi:hypothetical protein
VQRCRHGNHVTPHLHALSTQPNNTRLYQDGNIPKREGVMGKGFRSASRSYSVVSQVRQLQPGTMQPACLERGSGRSRVRELTKKRDLVNSGLAIRIWRACAGFCCIMACTPHHKHGVRTRPHAPPVTVGTGQLWRSRQQAWRHGTEAHLTRSETILDLAGRRLLLAG